MSTIKSIWMELGAKYSDNTALLESQWQEIESAYSKEERHYHTLNHLEYMLNLAKEFESFLNDTDTLKFSIFYHDIIYNAQVHDNEEQSAEIARDRLAELGVKGDKITKCQEQILATKSHEKGSDEDTNYLLDFDLAILGDTPKAYLTYSKNIRAEYAIYPDDLYRQGRQKVLQHFLSMDKIFKTDIFQLNRERQARANLTHELTALKHHHP